MRHTLRLACPATLTRPSGSKIIPFEPGSGPLNGSAPVYPLGCMKTLAPLPGIHRSMLFAGISANRRVPSCVQNHSVLEMCSCFLLETCNLHRAINLLTYTTLPVNATSFTAALKVCSDPTAFAACLEISANLRRPGELTNPPVEGRRQ